MFMCPGKIMHNQYLRACVIMSQSDLLSLFINLCIKMFVNVANEYGQTLMPE